MFCGEKLGPWISAQLRQSPRPVMDVERIRMQFRREFVPGDGHRDRGARSGTRRIGNNGGRPAVIPQVIDENLIGPRRLGHVRRELIRRGLGQCFSNLSTKGFGRIPIETAGDGDHQVQSFAACRLQETLQIQFRKKLPDLPRAFNDLFPREFRRGIEIKYQAIGQFELVFA